MSYRIVTPSSSGPDEAYLKSLVAYLQSNKQTNLKPNSGCKQKLNKRRPRVKTKSVSEDIEPNKSPQMNDVVDESYSVLTAESIPEKQLDESPLQKVSFFLCFFFVFYIIKQRMGVDKIQDQSMFHSLLANLSDVFYIASHNALPFCSCSCPSLNCLQISPSHNCGSLLSGCFPSIGYHLTTT